MWLTKKWFLIVVGPTIGLCVKAGFWQLDRADQKENLMQDLTVNESLLSSSSQILVAENNGEHIESVPVIRDAHEPLVFLDNRIQERVVGYEVFTRVRVSTVLSDCWLTWGGSRIASQASYRRSGFQRVLS